MDVLSSYVYLDSFPGFREIEAVILLNRFSVSLVCILPPLPQEFLGLVF